MQMSDLDAVSRLEQQAFDFPWGPLIFQQCLNHGINVWLAQRSDELLGYLVQSVILDETHVLNCVVATGSRHQGVGRKLMEHAHQYARQAGAKRAVLEVRPSNPPAIHLYHSLGYQTIATRPSYYDAVEGEREDAWIFEKKL